MIREAFLRKMFFDLMEKSNVKVRPGNPIAKILTLLFNQNKDQIHRVLYEISFFVAPKQTIIELDRTYSRCAGSLPKTKRDEIKESVLVVAVTF